MTLPTGTVTLLFTDVEGSTRLLESLRGGYEQLLAEHHRLLREVWQANGGVEVDTEGDAFFCAFSRAEDAVRAAAQAQRSLAEHSWPDGVSVRVRIGIHTGSPALAGTNYVGIDVHRAARISSAAHGGQVLLSQATRELVDERALEHLSLRDLGEHRLKDLTLPQRLWQLQGEGLENRFPPLKTLENRPTNLPTQPTPLVGRTRELQELQQLLARDDVRLLTLTGPGGTGKTRLALQLAAELIDNYPDGVWFVNLAALTDPALVLPTFAQTLTVKEAPGRPVAETLADTLADKQLLLVLDNFEQVADAAPALADLLARTRAPKLVVTSRTRLQLAAEHEYAAPTLALDEAVALFAERAQAAKQSYALNGNRPLVEEICRRLDHLPLAIELAAARIKLLPERALLERLDQRLKLLAGGARDLPARQQTLRAAIDWSYDLLAEPEQQLFARLAVFAGGRSLEAIEAVCNPDGDLDLLEGLASLVDKSLLRQEETAQGEPRFVMLETIHEYARERLEQSGHADALRKAHALYFAAIAAATDGSDYWRELDLIEREQDNLRSALSWAESADFELAAALVSNLFPFWEWRGQAAEGLTLTRRLLERGIAREEPRARLLRALGSLELAVGDLAQAEEHLRASVELLERIQDERALPGALNLLGGAAVELGRTDEALNLFERAASGYGRIGDERRAAAATVNLGVVALYAGNLDTAATALEQSLEEFTRTGARENLCITLGNLAILELERDRPALAEARFKESLRLATDIRNERQIAYALIGLAAVALREGKLHRMARLAGAAETALDDTSIALEMMEQQLFEEVKRALDASDALASQREEGRSWSRAQATAQALEEDREP